MMDIEGGTPEYDPLAPLGTDAGVLDRVDQVIRLDARHDSVLYLLFLAADAVQLPVVVSIDDMPASPDRDSAARICDLIGDVLHDAAPGGSAVIALVRQNGLSMTDPDQQWLMALTAAAELTGVHLRMFCLASRDGVRRLDSPDGERHGLSRTASHSR